LWKVGRTDKPGRLFRKTVKRNHSDFVVDILIDASGSQRDRQSQVALQAYVISEALSINHVPHRIMSFCSFWDYTILQRFREYDAPREENLRILDFVTSSNNRDGLAIRAVGDSLLQRPEEGRILIVLSDGKPNDIIVNRPNSRNPMPYYGAYAVKDTAYEVRRLRSNGVCVLGVFTGKEKDLMAEKKIFGRDFAYIRNIESFSKVTGRYLRRLLEDDSAGF
jgi:nitric oxide reductase activation protein